MGYHLPSTVQRRKAKMKFLKRFYWKYNFRVVIAVSFTVISIIGMLSIGIIYFSTYTNNSQRQIVEDNAQLVSQVEVNLTNYLRNMMRISDSLYYNVIKDTDFESDNIDREMTLLYEANRDNLVSIACFETDGTLVAAAPVTTLKSHASIAEQEWFVRALNKPENHHFSSSHVQNLFVDSDNRYYWVISLSRGIELTRDGNTTSGILLVDMNFSGIEHLFTKVNSNELGYMYLVDREGEIVYHPKQNLIYSQIAKENNIAAAEYDDGTHMEKFQGEERIVIVKTVGYTGWKIVSVIEKENLHLNNINAVWMTVLSIAILMLIVINQCISIAVTRPLHKLEKSVKQLDLQYPDKIYVGGPEEIRHLGETLRAMVFQMKKLMDDRVKEQEEKRKNELDALQSQINPHFLYNTLDSIVWMIESERYEEAVEMITALANLFRISLSQGKTIITIKEEFQHAQNYSNIQKMRFKNQFQVNFLLDEKLEKYLTIKLIIQPLLENAIYYGMEVTDGDGEILVSGYELDGDIYIDVVDNGIGMPPEQVERLLTGEPYERKRGSGIGLRNVDRRIKLCFGEDYGLKIKSEPDVGTKITIHLPMKLEVQDGK